jgi:hypothetical protein
MGPLVCGSLMVAARPLHQQDQRRLSALSVAALEQSKSSAAKPGKSADVNRFFSVRKTCTGSRFNRPSHEICLAHLYLRNDLAVYQFS